MQIIFFTIPFLHNQLLQVGTESQQTLTSNWLKLLGLWRVTSWRTNNQLSLELPISRDSPVLADLLINQWVVVLEVGTETLGLESSPGSELVHGVGLVGPARELVGVEWEAGLEALDGWGVVEEEDLGLGLVWV